MNHNALTISTALVLLLTGAVGAAEASSQHLHCKGAETFTDGVETHIDTNGDGQSATLAQGLENCRSDGGVPFTNTRFFFQEEVEWIPRPVTSACPAGTTEELYIDPTHGQHRGIATDEKTGDQLFGQVTAGTLCINTSAFPFPFTISVQTATIGGTGKYTGATGTGTATAAGSYLMFGIKDNVFGGFGHVNFTSDGTLTLPNDHSDHQE